VSDGQFLSSGTTRTVMVGPALTNILARWNFNSLTNTNSNSGGHPTVAADEGDTSSLASGANGVTGYRSSASGSVDTNAVNYSWATTGYGTNPPGAVVFAVNTTGKKDIEIELDMYSSNTGSKHSVVEISSDNVNWSPVLTNSFSSASSWLQKRYVNLKGNAAVENQPGFRFRVRPIPNPATAQFEAANTGSAFGSTGVWRFDMVSVAGVDGQFPPVITGPTTLSGAVGTAITPVTVTASGSPTSYGASDLPAGLSINPLTGQISGTPQVSVTNAIVQLSAENANGTGTANLTITISKGTPTITLVPVASAITAGQALSNSIISGGSVNPAGGTWAWSSPASTNTLAGTNSYAAVYTPASADQVNWNNLTSSLTVVVNAATGFNLNTWLAGQTMSPEVLGKLAIGGASSATANDGEKPAVSMAGVQLVLSAIVRTNGPAGLAVVGEAVSSLADYGTPASITTVNGVPAAVQGTVPDGCQRQEFKVNQDGNKKFLRLKATLP
jgi:hypothetical protein